MVQYEEKCGFGSCTKRFGGKYIYHPALDPSGLFSMRSKGCDPCLYHPIHPNTICKSKKGLTKDVWTYKKELEDWSKNLGFRNQQVLERVKWFRSIGGPAWTTVPPDQKCDPSACKNLGLGRTPRISRVKNDNPGPGTYYKEVPYKAPYGPHSLLPSFEQGDPCRFKDRSPSWLIAPNRYNIIDTGSADYKSKKVVSIRGPHDLFTGPRDQPMRNHFNTNRVASKTWPIALPGGFEKLKKSHLGIFNKTNRDKPYRGRNALVETSMCVRKPSEPGPGRYDLDFPRVFKQNMYGFNSSYDKPQGYIRAVVWPGVGRYSIKHPSCGIIGQGHRHVFLSKIERTVGAYIPKPMNSF